MPEMQEDRPTDQRNPALDEFVENVAKVNDGLSGVMAAALRMQMLMLDDARNMMAELNAAAERGDNGSDV
ncbi:MAG: hypothetical protein IIC53_10995 [Proteobacteria bacterium]|nr:hypothetical protein [Pseudomonadota bacterium]